MWLLQSLWHVASVLWPVVMVGEREPCALVGMPSTPAYTPLCILVPPVPSAQASGISSPEQQELQETWGVGEPLGS